VPAPPTDMCFRRDAENCGRDARAPRGAGHAEAWTPAGTLQGRKAFTARRGVCERERVSEKPEHALVLGASGFLGQAVVRQLAASGCRLIVLVHRRMPENLPSGVRVVRGPLGAASWTTEEAPDVIFHCARLSGWGKWGRYFAAWRGNLANRRLLRRLGRTRLVYASGSLMYGDCGEQAVFEDAPLRPTSYAREYVIAERPVLRDPRVIMFRPGWILGPGSWLEWFYLRGDAVPLYGSGKNLMSIIHRDDCAAAMVRVARHGEPGVYHPPNLAVVTQREFVERLAAELGLPIRQESLAGRDRAVREAFTCSINLRFRHDKLWEGFVPKFTDLSAALRDVLAACKVRIPQSASRV
jgi:nucleoside-diphosphate-sugar epimerase